MMKKNNTYKNKKMKYLCLKRKTKKKKTYQKKNNNINKNNTINKQKIKKNIKKNVKKKVKNKLSKKKIRSNKIKSKKLKGGTLTLEDKKIKNEIILKVMKNLYEEVQKKPIILNQIVLKYKETEEIKQDEFTLAPKYIPFDKLDNDGKINEKDIKNYVLIINKLIDHYIRYKNNFTSYNNRELFTINYMEININYLIKLFNEATTGVNEYKIFMKEKHNTDNKFIKDNIINAVNKPNFCEEFYNETRLDFNVDLDECQCKIDEFRTEEEIESMNQNLISLIKESTKIKKSKEGFKLNNLKNQKTQQKKIEQNTKFLKEINNIKTQITIQIELIGTLDDTDLTYNVLKNFNDRINSLPNIIKDLTEFEENIPIEFLISNIFNDKISDTKNKLEKFIEKTNEFINKINSEDSESDNNIHKLKKLIFKIFAFALLKKKKIDDINESITKIRIDISKNIKIENIVKPLQFINKIIELIKSLEIEQLNEITECVEDYKNIINKNINAKLWIEEAHRNLIEILELVKNNKQEQNKNKPQIQKNNNNIKIQEIVTKVVEEIILKYEINDAVTKFHLNNAGKETISYFNTQHNINPNKQNIEDKIIENFKEGKHIIDMYNNIQKLKKLIDSGEKCSAKQFTMKKLCNFSEDKKTQKDKFKTGAQLVMPDPVRNPGCPQIATEMFQTLGQSCPKRSSNYSN